MMMSSIMMLLLVLLGVAMGQVASNWDCMTSAKVNGVAIFKWNYASGGKTRSSTIWKFTPTGGTAGNIMIKSSNDDTPANVDPSYGSRLREICPTSTCPSGNNIGMVLSNLSAVDIGTYAVTVNFDDATSTEISQPLNVVDTATEPTDEFTIKQCGQVCENNICVNITDFKCEPKDNPYTLIVDLEDAKIETPVITILINGDTREECGNTLYCSYNADSTDCFVIEVMTADGSTLLFPETEAVKSKKCKDLKWCIPVVVVVVVVCCAVIIIVPLVVLKPWKPKGIGYSTNNGEKGQFKSGAVIKKTAVPLTITMTSSTSCPATMYVVATSDPKQTHLLRVSCSSRSSGCSLTITADYVGKELQLVVETDASDDSAVKCIKSAPFTPTLPGDEEKLVEKPRPAGSATTASDVNVTDNEKPRVLLVPPTNQPHSEAWRTPDRSPRKLPPLGKDAEDKAPGRVNETDSARRLPTLGTTTVTVTNARPLPSINKSVDPPHGHNRVSPDNTLDEGDENSDEARRQRRKKKKKKNKQRDEED